MKIKVNLKPACTYQNQNLFSGIEVMRIYAKGVVNQTLSTTCSVSSGSCSIPELPVNDSYIFGAEGYTSASQKVPQIIGNSSRFDLSEDSSSDTASLNVIMLRHGEFAQTTNGQTGTCTVPEANRGFYGMTVTNLSNGDVLIAGGFDGTSYSANAYLYDHNKGTFEKIQMQLPRAFHTATKLTNGKVLITGGITLINNQKTYLRVAELYDPEKKTFVSTGQMNVGRAHHTATLLGNGYVLITGGETDGGNILNTYEVYNPDTGQFRLGSNTMSVARAYHTATLYRPGGTRVMVIGGKTPSGATDSVDVFIFESQTMAPFTNNLNEARYNHIAESVKFGNSYAVVIAGGENDDGYLDTVEVWSGHSFQVQTKKLPQPMSEMGAIATPDGRVVIVGGKTASGVYGNAVVIQQDPAGSGQFITTEYSSTMAVPRKAPGVVLIGGDGNTMLIIGGQDSAGQAVKLSELFGVPFPQTSQ